MNARKKLPQSVFDHLTYSDCRPGASARIDNVPVSIYRELRHASGSIWNDVDVYVDVYVAHVGERRRLECSSLISLLSSMPALDYKSADWTEYVTHEC